MRKKIGLMGIALLLYMWSLAGDTTKINNAGLTLPTGFSASVWLDSMGKARHLVVTGNGTVYIKLDKLIDGKGIICAKDVNGDGRAEVVKSFGIDVCSS